MTGLSFPIFSPVFGNVTIFNFNHSDRLVEVTHWLTMVNIFYMLIFHYFHVLCSKISVHAFVHFLIKLFLFLHLRFEIYFMCQRYHFLSHVVYKYFLPVARVFSHFSIRKLQRAMSLFLWSSIHQLLVSWTGLFFGVKSNMSLSPTSETFSFIFFL